MVKKRKSKSEDISTENVKKPQSYIEALWRFLPLPICDVSEDFIIIKADRKFIELFGYSPEEIIGTSLERIFKSSDFFEEMKKELLKKKMVLNKEAIVITKKNKEIPVSIYARARENEKGSIISYFIAFIDMSEIKEKEKELESRIKELKRFQKLAIDRELKMVELKKDILKLKEKSEPSIKDLEKGEIKE